jgi:SAM-dependent methyltransferase
MHLMGCRRLLNLVAYFLDQFTRRLSPEAGLRFLLDLDTRLYILQGQRAVAYGNGKHPKHWLIKYHDFFVERIQASEHVLDIGCGIGALAYSIANRCGAAVTAVDISDRNIQMAKKKFSAPKITYTCGDARLGLPVQTCDVIVLSNVLEHLEDRPRLLRRMQRWTQPRRILIRVPVYEREWRVPLKKELGLEWRLDRTHQIEYTLETFAEEMQAAALDIVHMEVRWGEIWSELSPSSA